ncbi:MAG: YggS family pyridoxal phosphate-dependent enzyme [Candidatus Nanopelagicales bacterium]|jgi:PLP dependent protein|nr:YggS family pyridoxal phosphate-dependent enzyme [Candidatus Nanopelagicales bacterium]MDP4975737.1 YggS family pyridoxal phosphate-dependent enzyme [Candidatus Nanopelagicales bacterium]MDP5094590.1 YggS family pyridoxal phosphate-dependent enzyme [Candidatus Nanopelagicales bacterium]
MTQDRTSELAANLEAVRRRIDAACRSAGRSPADVTLIVVTKTWPALDVRRLASLGVHDVGENRGQEASVKAADTDDLDLRWHFVGQLQTNKAASVARYVDVVHSVDRLSLVQALDKGAAKAHRRLGCLVEVDLTDGGAGRGGVTPAEVTALADQIAAAPHLDLLGVMGVAPLAREHQRDASARAFGRLAELSDQVRSGHPEAYLISAGMSDDLEEAVSAGATHLRVGSAILGSRASLG